MMSVQPDDILETLSKNVYNPNYTVAQLSSDVHISEPRLRFMCKVYFGLPPMLMLETLRILRFLRLLQSSKSSHESCWLSGYSDTQTINHFFHHHLNITLKQTHEMMLDGKGQDVIEIATEYFSSKFHNKEAFHTLFCFALQIDDTSRFDKS
jgi:AraC-like DNA-binding protein